MRRVSENTASHVWSSADSKSRSLPECFRTATPAPSSAGNAIRHVPQALDHPGGMRGNTQKNKCACTRSITQTQHSRGHSDTHMYVCMYEPVCLSSGCEVDRFAASGVRGQRNFTTSRGLSGFSHWDPNTTETPNFLFAKYQRTGDPLSSKGCRHVRHSKKTSRNCRRLIQEGISHKELWFGQSIPSRGT